MHCEIVVFPDHTAYTDPGNIVGAGGGGGTSFFSPQLNLQKSNGFFSKHTIISQGPRGVQHFLGGPTFHRGSNLLFPIRT